MNYMERHLGTMEHVRLRSLSQRLLGVDSCGGAKAGGLSSCLRNNGRGIGRVAIAPADGRVELRAGERLG